jgi:hypothetical protein
MTVILIFTLILRIVEVWAACAAILYLFVLIMGKRE